MLDRVEHCTEFSFLALFCAPFPLTFGLLSVWYNLSKFIARWCFLKYQKTSMQERPSGNNVRTHASTSRFGRHYIISGAFPKCVRFIFKQNLQKILLMPRAMHPRAIGMKYYKTSFEQRELSPVFVCIVENYNFVLFHKINGAYSPGRWRSQDKL